MSLLVLIRRRLPDLTDFRILLEMENPDHGFRRGGPGKRHKGRHIGNFPVVRRFLFQKVCNLIFTESLGAVHPINILDGIRLALIEMDQNTVRFLFESMPSLPVFP
jgi:hypothetical protein